MTYPKMRRDAIIIIYHCDRERLLPSLAILFALLLNTGACYGAEKKVDKVLYPHDPQGVFRWSEGTSINLNGDGNLMMLISTIGQGGHDYTDGNISEARSSDGGLTWTALDQLTVWQENIGDQNIMAPSLVRLANGDILGFFRVTGKGKYSDMGPWVKRSTDNGDTWSEPWRLPYDGYGGPGCGRALQISTGRILLPCWVSHDQLGSTHCYVFYSDDQGGTWKKTELVSVAKGAIGRRTDPGAEEPMILELQNGRLMMIMRTYLKSIWVSYSDDQGQTWSMARSSGIPSPGSMATITRMPNGDVLLIWNWAPVAQLDGPWPRNRISTAISKDDGKNFSSIRHLDGADDFPGKITMANVCFSGDNAVITYSKSMTQKNAYSWQLQVIPIDWFYNGDWDLVYGEDSREQIDQKISEAAMPAAQSE